MKILHSLKFVFLLILIRGEVLRGESIASHLIYPIGISKENYLIQAKLAKDSLDLNSAKKHILLVMGMVPNEEVEKEAVNSIIIQSSTNTSSLSIILDANPDNVPIPPFPPTGQAYNMKETAAAQYLWRFIGNHGFDLVIDARKSDSDESIAGGRASGLTATHVKSLRLKPNVLEDTSFASALTRSNPANVAPIPALQLNYTSTVNLISSLKEISKAAPNLPYSPARQQLKALVARSPIHTAHTLAKHYGHDSTIAYIPALAQLARLHLAKLDKAPEHHTEVVQSLEAYVTGKKTALSPKVSGVNLAGHLTLAELAKSRKNPPYTKLVKAAAEQAHQSRGQDPKAPVTGHNQMSDSVFMVCPILAAAYNLTGNSKYLEDCLAHFNYLKSIDLRKDGIYRHSPMDEAAWGRGNGFPALGLALTLSWLDEGSAEFKTLHQELKLHLSALIQHQDPTGLWHQVIDHPGSYRELTSSCMFTFAIARGIRRGWLEKEKFLPVVQKSWPAINRRIGTNGELLDVCTGTGKQKNLRNYLDRTAILGKDARGGAMALLAATEMAALLQSNQ